MSSTLNPRFFYRDPCDYNDAYLEKIAAYRDGLKKSVDPKLMDRFLPLFSSLSNYIESGKIMLIYKNRLDQQTHYHIFQHINRTNALEFNGELAKLQNYLSLDQIKLCHQMALTILEGA